MQTKLTLARLLVQAWAMQEASYVPSRSDGTGGYYRTLAREAVQIIIDRDGLDPALSVPGTLMIYWSNDALEWAKEIIDADEAKASDTVADVTALADHAAYTAGVAEANALAEEALSVHDEGFVGHVI